MNTEIINLEASCEQLIARLGEIYTKYEDKCAAEDAKPKNIFAHMFGGGNKNQYLHERFLDDTSECITSLRENLEKLKEDTASTNYFAEAAINILFMPKPAKEHTDYQRYVSIAEFLHGPILFPYATQEVLKRIHGELVARLPRRQMFPKQEEMFALLSEMLK